VILRSDFTLAYFSPFAEQLTGYSAEEVLGQEYLPLLLDEKIRASVSEAIAGVLSGGTPAVGYEHPIQCRSHRTRDILWNAQRLDNYEGAPAILAVGHDITDLKRAQEKVLQSERLAAIGQTVTGLAHESRNAFQRSQACLEMLAVELEGRESELELVHRIQRALDHLHHLYEEVRDYASPIKLDRQPCNLSHVWRDAWSHLEVLRREKSVNFFEDTGTFELTAEVDWFKMGQVFRNLLENALSACPEGGIISIKCRETQRKGRTCLEVTVRDNGPGFPTSVREHAFDAFFTTKAKGTGLGMAIAKRIVEAHGGRIEIVDSSPGAEIAITLPRS
jgi:PAS domain S-box-containing protein